MKQPYAVLLLGILTACSSGDVQETLGLDRKAPDEFRVVSRPPLAVPPEFNLRPPGDMSGAAPSSLPVEARAQNIIRSDGEAGLYQLPSGAEESDAARPVELIRQSQADSADAQFLMNAGATHANSNIREELQSERTSRRVQQEEQGWWDSMWDWEKDEPVIDAGGEADRIQTNQEQGKPVNEGEVKESKDGGLWGRIFGD
ncbi:MAG: DUF3035 domain-containing protein [Alphaproteobacteria bacterium]